MNRNCTNKRVNKRRPSGCFFVEKPPAFGTTDVSDWKEKKNLERKLTMWEERSKSWDWQRKQLLEQVSSQQVDTLSVVRSRVQCRRMEIEYRKACLGLTSQTDLFCNLLGLHSELWQDLCEEQQRSKQLRTDLSEARQVLAALHPEQVRTQASFK